MPLNFQLHQDFLPIRARDRKVVMILAVVSLGLPSDEGSFSHTVKGMIRYCLKHPKTPRPLRFSRDRALRHWTIHRAAQLLLHKTRRERERALEKQYNAMRDAMEELRLGCGDGGRLYRQAVTKQGVYGGSKMEQEMAIVGNGGIPLEYARAQTEGPPVGGFNEDWKRT